LRRILSDILKRTEGKSLTNHSIQGWLADWIAARRPGVTPGTLTKYNQIRKDFLGSLGKRASARLDSISQSDLIRFRDSLLEGGRSPATVNHILNVLTSPFKLAFQQGLIHSNPLAGVSRIKADHVEKGTFSADEIGALLKVASLEWQGVILSGYYTGARLTDITRLSWKNIHLETRRIRFTAKKTGRPAEGPMHPELEEFLLHELSLQTIQKISYSRPWLSGKPPVREVSPQPSPGS
jgi:integrase